MTTIKLASFNCENLFARYKFSSKAKVETAVRDGWLADKRRFDINDRDAKRITGNAIEEADADIVALQEVEGLDTLKRFRNNFIDSGSRSYPYVALIDGNDPRMIDVAVLSRRPITRIRTHQQLRPSPRSRRYTFSRDCLEVDVDCGGTTLAVFVQHYKSMIGGRDETRNRREEQVAETRKIVERRFGRANTGDHPWAIVGDFNDYVGLDTSLNRIVNWRQAENVVERLPEADRWTHFWNKKKQYRQLDYILLSKSLAEASPAMPEIIRKGMPHRATRYTGPRFRGVGESAPKASDHCPVVMTLEI
jgi:endonuclease/exonuclease/phosphatase family metal-dependent hydrolase